METPARALDLPVDEGFRILHAEWGTWLDGGEARVREILASASDLSSLSDELAGHDESWEDDAVMMNFPTRPFDKEHPDKHRIDAHSGAIPFDWSLPDN